MYRALFDQPEKLQIEGQMFQGFKYRARVVVALLATIAILLPLSMPFINLPVLQNENLCSTCVTNEGA